MDPAIDYDFDRQHIWHPYTSMTHPIAAQGVVSGKGCELTLDDGRKMIFSGVAEGKSDLYLYQVIGNNQQQLTNETPHEGVEARHGNDEYDRDIDPVHRSSDSVALDGGVLI